MIGVFFSLSVCFFVSCFPHSFFYKKSFFIFFISVLINLLLFVPSLRYAFHGVPRWLKCGPILFQPSELLKVSFILYMAHLFTYYADQISFLLMKSVGAFLITIGLLYYQSDFGTTILICAVYIMLLWNFSYKKNFLWYFFGIIIAMLLILIALKPYRIMRILTFLNPWQDQLKSGFQIIQSFVAIQHGGLLGVGFGLSKQKKLFLPMPHSDFIFSIILEEIGLIGGMILLSVMLYFSSLFISYSFKRESLFDRNYLFAVGLVFFCQTVINVGGVTGLIPLKGIGLPLISYGISSLIGFGIIIGIGISLLHRGD